ncbi:hypothetical protein AAFF_G00239580 [Aldrovandia affinis]|uniref:Uncharacterized protein n=1 Tax=Aldrovandia affinis TaxID=143900 RepID=A0AAD7RGS9_9TELE|nr:hypothetical protein AAFF_G00239580 [Aldrovandia affinis]
MEFHIQQECGFLCVAIREEQATSEPRGYLFNPSTTINNAIANVIGALVFGQRFHYSNTDFQNLMQSPSYWLARLACRRKKTGRLGSVWRTWRTLDLFEAGTETLTNTLRWALLFMIKYPEVQSR